MYPFAVEAWKLAARMGEKEDWSLVRVLTKLVRDCSVLGYYTVLIHSPPKPGRPCQAKPSAAQGIACPGSILTTVKRKKEVKKGEVDVDWFGVVWGWEERGGVRVQIK